MPGSDRDVVEAHFFGGSLDGAKRVLVLNPDGTWPATYQLIPTGEVWRYVGEARYELGRKAEA